jgi:hypothetical protein
MPKSQPSSESDLKRLELLADAYDFSEQIEDLIDEEPSRIEFHDFKKRVTEQLQGTLQGRKKVQINEELMKAVFGLVDGCDRHKRAINKLRKMVEGKDWRSRKKVVKVLATAELANCATLRRSSSGLPMTKALSEFVAGWLSMKSAELSSELQPFLRQLQQSYEGIENEVRLALQPPLESQCMLNLFRILEESLPGLRRHQYISIVSVCFGYIDKSGGATYGNVDKRIRSTQKSELKNQGNAISTWFTGMEGYGEDE